MADAQTPKELTKDQQIAELTLALNTRGRALKLAFAFCGVLLVFLVLMLQINSGLGKDLTTGREERRAYQAETRYLICFLADDDKEIAEPEVAERVRDLCEGYESVEDAHETENSRDNDGKLPEPR